MADALMISCFLNTVKNVDIIDIVSTEKNRQTRYLLGLTIEDQEEMIRNLTANEYHSGPLT